MQGADARELLRTHYLHLALRVPDATLGARRDRPAHQSHRRASPLRRVYPRRQEAPPRSEGTGLQVCDEGQSLSTEALRYQRTSIIANELREIMNTVSKQDRLGELIRRVVSVSSLLEARDTSNVIRIRAVRAFCPDVEATG